MGREDTESEFSDYNVALISQRQWKTKKAQPELRLFLKRNRSLTCGSDEHRQLRARRDQRGRPARRCWARELRKPWQ